MDYAVLKAELTLDPLTRGYAGMSDAEVVADLNTSYRSRNRATMTASEILNATTKAAYDALADAQKDTLWRVLSMGQVNPFGVEADIIIGIFGAGSETIQTLAGLRVESVSRAVELGLGRVRNGDVAKARS